MKLILNNFKNHDYLEVDIPSRGLVRLDGPSGRGKSTVLLAFKFALEGNERSIKNWDKKKTKTSVELQDFLGLHIIRTNTPNTLTVTYEGVEYKDDAAQGVIDEVLGMDENEFMVSSYIKQEGANSILNVDPSIKSKIIQNLISKDDTIEKIKKALDVKLDETKAKLIAEQEVQSQIQGLLSNIENDFPEDQRTLVEPIAPEGLIDDLEDAEKALTEARAAESAKANRDTTLAAKKEEFVKIDLRIGAIEDELQETCAYAPPKPWKGQSKEDVDALKQKYIKKAEFINKFNEIIMLVQRTHDRFPEAKGYQGKISGWIAEKMRSLETNMELLNNKAGSVSKQWDDLQNWDEHMDCPGCQAKLKVYENKLVEAKQKPADFDEKMQQLKDERAEIMKASKEMSEDMVFLKSTTERANELKAALGVDPAPEIKTSEELDDLVNKVNEYITQQNRAEKDYNDHETAVNAKIAIQEDLKKQLEVLRVDLERLEKTEIDPEVDSHQLYVSINVTRDYIHEKSLYEARKKRLDDYNNRVADLKEKMAELKVDDLAGKVGALERLKEKAGFAASAAMDGKINEMNTAAEEHIDRMFEDDGTVIRLTSTKTTGKGEERAKIDTSIYHKGSEVSKFSELSGGEKSRGLLAYQLGLGDLYSSPLLMVDEGLPGLPPEKKEICLEILREAAENKLVLVIEHGVRDSFFDEVISL